MKQSTNGAGICGAVAAGLLAAALVASPVAADPKTQGEREGGSTNPQATMDYDNTSGQPERFEGELVCLRTDRRLEASPAAECPDERKVFALTMPETGVIEPLIALDQKTRDQLADNLGERVVIEGKRYEGTGMILAQTIIDAGDAK